MGRRAKQKQGDPSPLSGQSNYSKKSPKKAPKKYLVKSGAPGAKAGKKKPIHTPSPLKKSHSKEEEEFNDQDSEELEENIGSDGSKRKLPGFDDDNASWLRPVLKRKRKTTQHSEEELVMLQIKR